MYFRRILTVAMVLPIATLAAPVPEPFLGALIAPIMGLIGGFFGGGGFGISSLSDLPTGFPQLLQQHIEAAEDSLGNLAKLAIVSKQPEAAIIIANAGVSLAQWNLDMSSVLSDIIASKPIEAEDETKIPEGLEKAQNEIAQLSSAATGSPELEKQIQDTVTALSVLSDDSETLMTASKKFQNKQATEGQANPDGEKAETKDAPRRNANTNNKVRRFAKSRY